MDACNTLPGADRVLSQRALSASSGEVLSQRALSASSGEVLSQRALSASSGEVLSQRALSASSGEVLSQRALSASSGEVLSQRALSASSGEVLSQRALSASSGEVLSQRALSASSGEVLSQRALSASSGEVLSQRALSASSGEVLSQRALSASSGEVLRMRAWLRRQTHLHARTDAGSVLRFLRGCKFNEERTRHKLTNFYVMKAKVPEWFSGRDPLLPQLQEMLDLGVFLPLRCHCAEGHLSILIRAAAHDPKAQELDDVFKVGNMVVDALLEEDELVSVYGVVAVCDLAGVSLGHVRQLTPSIIKKAVHSWQNCYPVRIKSLVFINAPLHVGVVLSVFKRFMSEKLRNRVQIFYIGSDYLKGISDPQLLPQEYGGEGGKLQDLIDYWKQHMVERRDWLLQQEMYKADV